MTLHHGSNHMNELTSQKLREIVQGVEAVRDQKSELTEVERKWFTYAKGLGFDSKALRKVIARRKVDPRELDEQDMILDAYERAIGGG